MEELGIVMVFVAWVGRCPYGEGFRPPYPDSWDGGPWDGWVVHSSIGVAVRFRGWPGVADDLFEH